MFLQKLSYYIFAHFSYTHRAESIKKNCTRWFESDWWCADDVSENVENHVYNNFYSSLWKASMKTFLMGNLLEMKMRQKIW